MEYFPGGHDYVEEVNASYQYVIKNVVILCTYLHADDMSSTWQGASRREDFPAFFIIVMVVTML